MSELETERREARAALRFRGPRAEDGRLVHELVAAGGVLELNTTYAYVLMCDHFASTCVIAEAHGAPAGFVVGYRPPSHPESVFVWQVGVHPSMRGRGLGRALLDALVRRPGCRGVRYLEATVAPSNEASTRLFTSFARVRGAPVEWTEGYAGALFGSGHEPEPLVRIGPLDAGRALA